MSYVHTCMERVGKYGRGGVKLATFDGGVKAWAMIVGKESLSLLAVGLLLSGGLWGRTAAEGHSADTLALPKNAEGTGGDTIASLPDTTGLPKNGLKAPVSYVASDSMIMTAGNRAYIYGKGRVKYEQVELESEEIEMDLDSSVVFARFGRDSVGEPFGYPLFRDGGQQYESRTMRYNFKTKRGYITDVITEQGEGYVTSERTKRLEDDVLNMTGGKYTTCDEHDHPHFYIQMTKAKVRPKKNIVTGPVYLVLEDVPLYVLGLPFAYFPFSETYSSGILFPTYGEESARGFYLREGGYYFALNDYMDLAVTGEFYTKGSWGANARSSYRKRYRFNGSFNASWLVTKLGDKGLPDYSLTRDFKLNWTHTQDAKANPYVTFSASVNFATTGYDHNNIQGMYVPTSTQNTKGSSVSISKRFPNNPLSLSATMNVNQSARDTMLSVTLPDLTISMSRIYPFKRKQMAGSERWYEKISASYSGSLRNSIATKEYRFMESNVIRDWKNAMQHQLPVSATFNVLGYVNVSPSVNYRERWYTNKIEKGYDAEQGSVVTVDTAYGFYRVYDYSTSLSASTTLYGFFQPLFPLLGLKTLRHRMDLSVSIGFTPDFGSKRYGFYKEYAYENASGEQQTVVYSPFEQGMFGVPGRGKQGTVSFGWDNNIEGKFRSDRDSTGEVKRMLIDKLSFGISHNLMADSFKWSDLNVGLRLKLTKSYTLNLNGVFDTYTYAADEAPDGSQTFHRQNIMRIQAGKGLGRLRSTGTSFSYTFNNDTFKKWFGRKEPTDNSPPEQATDEPENLRTLDEFGEIKELVPEEQSATRLRKPKTPTAKDTDADGYWLNAFPWSLSFNYSLSVGYGNFNYDKKEYNYRVTQALSFSGNLQPTKNWRVNFNATYDFDTKRLSYLTCNISRNLHCFNMTAGIIPVGNYKSYSFSIAVSSALLKDLKYDRRSNYRDAQQWY